MALLVTLALWILLALVTLWVCGALYFDLGHGSVWGVLAVLVWVGLVVTCIIQFSLSIAMAIVGGASILLVIWWFTLQPKQDREWDLNFSKTCRIHIQGDQIEVENVRNTHYRSLTDYDLHYETRSYLLSDLQGADVLILFWGTSLLSHPMIIFDFGDNQHLCFSVEVRYRANQTYNFFKAIYRQYELMYVVSDERDAILRRSKHAENQDCYLYRLRGDEAGFRQLFMEYAEAANDLAERPRWYHAITDNCTTSVIKRRVEKMQFDLRFYMNGSLDRLLYERELIGSGVPFDQFKEKSYINPIANSASVAEFSQAIRKNLPPIE